MIATFTPFWCNILQEMEGCRIPPHSKYDDKNLASIIPFSPPVEWRGYFGPCEKAKGKERLGQQIQKKQKVDTTFVAGASKHVYSSNQSISNVVSMQHQIWYDFDPHIDLQIDDFIGVHATEDAQDNGEMFWVAKVLEVRKVAREDG